MINTRIRPAPLDPDEDPLIDPEPQKDHRSRVPGTDQPATARGGEPQNADPQNEDRPDADLQDEQDDALDPIPDLADLLALHIDSDEREEFHYEFNILIDTYIGPNAPANRHLHPVA